MDENLQAGTAKTKTNGQRNQETPNIAKTVRILRVEIQSCRAYNERLNKGPKEQNQLNATMLQSLTTIQRKMHRQLSKPSLQEIPWHQGEDL